MGESLAQQVAAMSREEQEEALAGLDEEALLWDWSFWAREEQIPPDGGGWSLWLLMAGRGAGKTRSAAEWIRKKAREEGQRMGAGAGSLRLGLMARTAARSPTTRSPPPPRRPGEARVVTLQEEADLALGDDRRVPDG